MLRLLGGWRVLHHAQYLLPRQAAVLLPRCTLRFSVHRRSPLHVYVLPVLRGFSRVRMLQICRHTNSRLEGERCRKANTREAGAGRDRRSSCRLETMPSLLLHHHQFVLQLSRVSRLQGRGHLLLLPTGIHRLQANFRRERRRYLLRLL